VGVGVGIDLLDAHTKVELGGALESKPYGTIVLVMEAPCRNEWTETGAHFLVPALKPAQPPIALDLPFALRVRPSECSESLGFSRRTLPAGRRFNWGQLHHNE
jgi:hypothetical protein